MPKPLFILIFLLSTAVYCGAQTFGDDFEVDVLAEDDFRDVDVDETVIGALMQQIGDGGIYPDVIRYAFRFVQMRERGGDELYRVRRLDFSDISERINITPDYSFYSLLGQASVVSGYGICSYMPAPEYSTAFNPQKTGGTHIRTSYSDRYDRGTLKVSNTGFIGGTGLGYEFRGSASIGRDSHTGSLYGSTYMVSVKLAKEFSDKSQLSLFLLAAPVVSGTRMWTTREAFRLTGDELYNPSWGRWNGKVRNVRVRKNFTPLLNVRYGFDVSPSTLLTATVTGIGGLRRYGVVDWWNAPNPYPDYYQSLPSGYDDPVLSGIVAERWRTGDERYTQIDWDVIRQINKGYDGEPGSAAYILGNRVERVADININLSGKTALRSGVGLTYSVACRSDNRRFYKEAADMLGLDYALNIDRFLLLNNNLNAEDGRIYPGDRYDYDYSINRNEIGFGFGGDYADRRLRFSWKSGVFLSTVRREGNFNRSGIGDSYGKSGALRHTSVDFSAGLSYFSGNGLTLGAGVFASSYAPRYENLFVYPAYSNDAFSDVPNTGIYGAEGNLRYSPLSWLDLDLSAYFHLTGDRSRICRYYDDFFGDYAIMQISGEKYSATGIETGLKIKPGEGFYIKAALSCNRYEYLRDVKLNIVNGRDFEPLLAAGEGRVRGYVPVVSPQNLLLVEISYRLFSQWYFALNWQYASSRYVSMNPLRRATHITAASLSPESRGILINQERLPAAGTLNLFVSARFSLSKAVSGYVNLSVSNIMDKEIIYGGYEQMRLHKDTPTGSFTPFDSKVTYGYPRMVTVSMSLYI